MNRFPRVLLTRRWPAVVEEALRQSCEVTINASDKKLSSSEFRQAMVDYDILCPTVSDRIDASVLDVSGRSVKLIANYGAGVDHIDLAAAKAAGLTITNTPDVLTQATAELALLLMLMVSRRAGEGERELRDGRWAGWRPTHLLGRSLAGKTLGLIGFGRIGQATAALAGRALNMRILYNSRSRATASIEDALGARYVASVEELAAIADVLSLHCHGGAETHHLIDAAMIARMKPDAILINTARGSIVNEADLAVALRSGRIAGAGLDVFEREPDVDSALLGLENAVLLPHLGSATAETRADMGFRVVANVERFIKGEDVLDRVV